MAARKKLYYGVGDIFTELESEGDAEQFQESDCMEYSIGSDEEYTFTEDLLDPDYTDSEENSDEEWCPSLQEERRSSSLCTPTTKRRKVASCSGSKSSTPILLPLTSLPPPLASHCSLPESSSSTLSIDVEARSDSMSDGSTLNGTSHSPSGRSHSPRGRSHSPSGRSHSPSGSSHSPSGRSHSPRGRSHSPRGRSHSPRGKSGVRPRHTTVNDEEFIWNDLSKEDKEEPKLHDFQPKRPPGPQLLSASVYSPLQLFQLFMPWSVVKTIVDNTNSFAKKMTQAGKKISWNPLTVEEFYSYVGLVIFMGLTPLKCFTDYWSKKSIYSLPFPSSVMSRRRFLAITWNLHLCEPNTDEENKQKKGTPEYDRLFKIKPLYTDILSACQTYFQPGRELSVDERMVASKGRIGLKQYMKNKPTKWGYKFFVLADSANGYTWNFFVYEGKNGLKTGNGLSYDSVVQLVSHPLLGKGYKIYMDNFYTSPKLLSDLYAANTLACGTLRMTRQLPNDMPKTAKRGTMRWYRRGQLLFVKWMDNKEVVMCSTMHKAYSGDMVNRRVKDNEGVWQVKEVPIPCPIKDYNKNMGGVDLSDALVNYYTVLHKTRKWYKTFFYHFIDIVVVNSFILHKELAKARSQRAVTQKQFREILAADLSRMFNQEVEPSRPPKVDQCYPLFFSEDPRVGRRVCELCKKDGKKVKTLAYCNKCQVPLCLMPKRNCFFQWHVEELRDTPKKQS